MCVASHLGKGGPCPRTRKHDPQGTGRTRRPLWPLGSNPPRTHRRIFPLEGSANTQKNIKGQFTSICLKNRALGIKTNLVMANRTLIAGSSP